jgi:hypothetical protein
MRRTALVSARKNAWRKVEKRPPTEAALLSFKRLWQQGTMKERNHNGATGPAWGIRCEL